MIDDGVMEEEFVYYIEEWRKVVGLEKMIFLGYSFGGYLVMVYVLKYFLRIKYLILFDVWGFVILFVGIVDRYLDVE